MKSIKTIIPEIRLTSGVVGEVALRLLLRIYAEFGGGLPVGNPLPLQSFTQYRFCDAGISIISLTEEQFDLMTERNIPIDTHSFVVDDPAAAAQRVIEMFQEAGLSASLLSAEIPELGECMVFVRAEKVLIPFAFHVPGGDIMQWLADQATV